ncbi:MAG: metal ABC transporter permease [Anaerolineales bacterium]
MNAALLRKQSYDDTTRDISNRRSAPMLEWLIDPLTYGFMQRGLMASLIVGILCSVIGCYVVLRSMAFLGDALAHAILPGVAIAYLLGGNLLIGALIAAILVALGIGFFSNQGALREDTAIGILFAAALSLGVVLISSIKTYAVDLTHILFGNILGVSVADLWLTGILSLVVLGTIFLLYKEFLVITFDPVLAATMRLPAQLLRNLMLILLSFTVVVSLQTVGVGLVVAMLVTPGATAYLLTRRLPSMMLVSAGFGIISSLAGLYFSYYANVASGAAIVLTATAIFLLVFMIAPQRGVIWQHVRSGRSLS